jgi:hypothetical protein
MENPGHPPSTLRNVDGGPLGGGARDTGAPTINAKKRQRRAPWEEVPEIWERPPSMQETSTAGAQAPVGVLGLHLGSKRCAMTCISMIDKK